MATCNCRGGSNCCMRQQSQPLNQATGVPWTCPVCGVSHPWWKAFCDHSRSVFVEVQPSVTNVVS